MYVSSSVYQPIHSRANRLRDLLYRTVGQTTLACSSKTTEQWSVWSQIDLTFQGEIVLSRLSFSGIASCQVVLTELQQSVFIFIMQFSLLYLVHISLCHHVLLQEIRITTKDERKMSGGAKSRQAFLKLSGRDKSWQAFPKQKLVSCYYSQWNSLVFAPEVTSSVCYTQ